MQNRQLDLAAGQSLTIAEYRVTLISTTDHDATFEIEGPDGTFCRQTVPTNSKTLNNPQCSTNVTA